MYRILFFHKYFFGKVTFAIAFQKALNNDGFTFYN